MTIFSNIIYPDNAKRAQRVLQLSNDCIYEFLTIRRLTDEIDLAAKSISDVYAISPTVSDLNNEKAVLVDLASGWTVTLPYSVAQIIAKKIIGTAFNYGASAATVTNAAASSSAFADLVGLPRWLGLNRFTNGVMSAVLADLVISAIQGADQRAALRRAIHDLVDPRLRLHFAAKQLELFRDWLTGIALGVSTLSLSTEVGQLDESVRMNMMNGLSNNYRVDLTNRMSEWDQNRARMDLARFDAQRQSFTSEDA